MSPTYYIAYNINDHLNAALSFASLFSPSPLGMQCFIPVTERLSTSVLQMKSVPFKVSHQIPAFSKALLLSTVAITARVFGHSPGATRLLKTWFSWEVRRCGWCKTPLARELLSTPCYPKSSWLALLPWRRLCWAFAWATGSTERRDRPSAFVQ